MTEGCAEGCPTEMDGSLWDLVHDRWSKGKHPEMKVLSWDRQRKAQRPEMPTEAGSRLEFAKALADDYVVRSKEKVTWASYRGWWMVFMEFMRFVGVDQGEGTEDWRVCVEVLRFACAMMAKEYALGTIKIFISAVSFYFKMKGWQAPYTNERFQMTMQGIARDIGDRKIKKPPVEARHVAVLMGMDIGQA